MNRTIRQSEFPARAAGLAIAAAALLPGCGNSLSGTYSNARGFIEVTFKSGGKAELSAMGTTRELSYEIDEGKVRVTDGKTIELWPILDDGCLKGGGLIGKLCKKS